MNVLIEIKREIGKKLDIDGLCAFEYHRKKFRNIYIYISMYILKED